MSLVRIRTKARRRIFIAAATPLVIIGVPLSILLVVQLRSLGHLERASRQILAQSATRVAEDFASRLHEEVALAGLRYLADIPESAVRGGGAALRDVLAGDSTLPLSFETFFVGSRSARESERLLHFATIPLNPRSGAAEATISPVASLSRPERTAPNAGPAADTELEALVASVALEAERSRVVGVTRLMTRADGRRLLLFLRLYPGESEAAVGYLAGLALDVGSLIRVDFPRLVGEMRAESSPLGAEERLDVSVLDDRRTEVYRTGPSLATGPTHEVVLPLEVDGDLYPFTRGVVASSSVAWSVRAGFPGTDAAALARSSTNQQRQLLLLVSVVAAGGIGLTGRAIAREIGVAELKDEFVASISHDLRTPLASIHLLAQNLSALRSLDRVGHYGSVISAEARKLGKMIDDILEFEKIEGGSRMYEGTWIDLREPLRLAIGEFAVQLRDKGAETELRFPAEPVPFVGDSDALMHAFGNVIGNAIKYSEDEYYLRVAMSVEEGGNAVVEIRDRGRGIPAGERARVFDRFYRVVRDARTDPAGTGLGLAITRHVIRSHGGRISVTGAPGGGSIFRIELPLVHRSIQQEKEA